MELGQFLRGCRESAGRTQPNVATAIGIEQSYLSKIESGKSIPSEEVFNKLQQAYGFDIEDLVSSLSKTELDKLSEISSITDVAFTKNKEKLHSSRTWTISGLAMLMVGAGLLAFSTLPDRTPKMFKYRSEGVLTLEEELNTFDLVYLTTDELKGDQAQLEKRKLLLSRLDQEDVISLQYKGDGYLINTDEGRRYYKFIDAQAAGRDYWNRWFLVPAFMLLVGGIGCFVISKRWNTLTS